MIKTRIFAVAVSSTSLAMSFMAGLDRGGTHIDQVVMIASGICACAGSQFILSISRRKVAWIIWSICLLITLYINATFLSYASSRAGEGHAQHSLQSESLDRQMSEISKALDNIQARPVAIVNAELMNENGWRKRNALKIELSESQKVEALHEQMIELAGAATTLKVSGTINPVTASLATVTGSNAQNIRIFIELLTSIVLECMGAFLWFEIDSKKGLRETSNVAPPTYSNDHIIELEAAVAAGTVKPTVKEIRAFLSCSQIKAMDIRKRFKA